MNPTDEQIEAMHDGETKERNRRKEALDAALDAMRPACDACWCRQHDKCEQKRCSIWRMSQTWQQVLRMRSKGQLDSWDWYKIARNEGRMLFIDDFDGRSPADTGKGDETKTQHNTPPSVL